LWTGFYWLGLVSSADFCEHDNEPSHSMKVRNCFTSWSSVSFWRTNLYHAFSYIHTYMRALSNGYQGPFPWR